MNDKLDLRLPDRSAPRAATGEKLTLITNLLVLVMVGAVLAVVSYKSPFTVKTQRDTALSKDVLKQLALKLETQGIIDPAVRAWKDYLAAGSSDAAEAARIWYRIGTLYQNDQQYNLALAAYYRSESHSRIPNLSSDISRRVQASLEAMGKFAALRDELAQRVGITDKTSAPGPSKARSTVVAEIGPEKLTLSDLDHRIEKAIDRRIAVLALYLPKEARNQQKEALLKKYSTSEQRAQFLHQYLTEEILYREARAENIAGDPTVQAEIREQERATLAQNVIARAYKDNIKITKSDLRTYYDAHKSAYVTKGNGKKPPLQRSFDEAENDIYRDLRARKEREVRQHLLRTLQEKYNVVLHSPALDTGTGPDMAKQGNFKTPHEK